MIIPSHIQIETVHKICNARCKMCVIDLMSGNPDIMSNEDFMFILNKFKKYKKHIKYISLSGLGETLMDKNVSTKVKIAKKMGFNGIGLPTNCSKLNEKMATSLIESGLDTLICSIDGFTKETHESIRVGTNFNNIVSNVKKFIEIRNKLYDVNNNIKTRVLIRFIYQDSNRHEWNKYHEYWSSFINKNIGDNVTKFNIHSCGDKLKNYKSVNDNLKINNLKTNDLKTNDLNNQYNSYICEDIYDRFIIYTTGNVIFCCADTNNFNKLGNIFYDDPIKIYNNEVYTKYRKFMNENRMNELELCKNCTLAQSRMQLREQ